MNRPEFVYALVSTDRHVDEVLYEVPIARLNADGQVVWGERDVEAYFLTEEDALSFCKEEGWQVQRVKYRPDMYVQVFIPAPGYTTWFGHWVATDLETA